MQIPESSSDQEQAQQQQPTSWLHHKNQGKKYYDRGEYALALESYRLALHYGNDILVKQDEQLLWSNVVACRLQLGGVSHATAAVQDARRCVACNPQWAKGHIRLASALIAQVGGDGTSSFSNSNEACNALQTAIRLDPSNTTAKQMLLKELRARSDGSGGRRTATTTRTQQEQNSVRSNNAEQPHNNHDYEDRIPPRNPLYREDDNDIDDQQQPQQQEIEIDDDMTWQERLWLQWHDWRIWYGGWTDTQRTLFQVSIVFVLLCVLFSINNNNSSSSSNSYSGIADSSSSYRGHYDGNSAYDEYKRRKLQQQQHQRTSSNNYNNNNGYSSSSSSHSYQKNHDNHHHNSNYDDNYYSSSSTYNNNSSWDYSGTGNGFYWLMIAAVVYIAHRFQLVHPVQAIWMIQVLVGRGGGGRQHVFRRGYGGGGGGWGYGGGGWGYGGGGMRAPRHRGPHAPAGGWW